ncbi:MAG: hypothetical protein U0984_06855 [Prosthecobacter sp.]|nr:hypothetical protein [Prosthecobacter sp.]
MISLAFVSPFRLGWLIWASALGMLLGVGGAVAQEVRFGVDLSERPDAVGLSAFNVCVVRADAKLDLEAIHALGTTCLAQIDLFEVPLHSEAAKQAESLGVPLRESGKTATVRMDATHPGWLTVVVRVLAKTAVERGFDGLVLAGLPAAAEATERAAVAQVIAALDAMYPDKQMVMRDAAGLLGEAGRYLEGILITDKAAQEAQIREALRLGLKPYVMEFASEADRAEIPARAQAIQALGGLPFYTTVAQDGANLGPLREITRKILVLHSGDARQSFTAAVLHGTLQWLGYQVIYREANAAMDGNEPAVAGVIFDRSLKLTAAQQQKLTQLATRLAEQKVRILLTGMPWDSAETLAGAAKLLGLQGSGVMIQPVKKPTFAKLDGAALMQGGSIVPRTEDFRDLRAPAGARVLVSVRSSGQAATTFDAAYLTNWGGVWFDSLAAVAGPQVSPSYFLEQWLGGKNESPVMDVTSQNGSRLMVSQIASEGFTEVSSTKGLPLAAEAMLERVLKRYGMPFTVALCEGDVRGWTPASEARDALRYLEAARSIMALPQVEAASASLSRPNNWDAKAFAPGPLDTGAAETRFSMEREIGGSMAYIHRQLLPQGKSVAMMLWPQGAAPSTAAIIFARKMGVESLECFPSPLLPGRLNPAAPISWGSGAEFKTSILNPRQGRGLDAAAIIADAQRTGTGCWQAPVQVALSFADTLNDRSLREVEKLLDWCATQPLHALTAAEYTHIVADAARTRILEVAPRHWIIVNQGRARTLRLPAAAGVPDMTLSTGISGYSVQGGQVYVHTLGRRRTELVMQAQPKPGHLRFTAGSGRLEFMEAGSRRVVFQVADWRPVKVTFAGLQPGATCVLRANGGLEHVTADAKGALEFTVPSQAVVQLQQIPSNHAALR